MLVQTEKACIIYRGDCPSCCILFYIAWFSSHTSYALHFVSHFRISKQKPCLPCSGREKRSGREWELCHIRSVVKPGYSICSCQSSPVEQADLAECHWQLSGHNENTRPKKGRHTLQLYKPIFTRSISNGYLELNDLFNVIFIQQIFTEYLRCPRY